jgi:glutamine synthetase
VTGEPLVYACVGDISGKVRGKGFPAARLPDRLRRGVGWTPTNVQITCFDTIAASPYGSFGDVVLWPRPETEVRVSLGEGRPLEHFLLGDVTHTDGRPWEGCLRTILRATLERFTARTGLSVVAAFEHEFMLKGDGPAGAAFSLDGFRRAKRFGETLMGALRDAGMAPDSFLREFGRRQHEVTVEPAPALRAADQALVLRELAHAAALACGEAVTFTPLADPGGVGNGVHVHFSFQDGGGAPATYDPAGPHGLSPVAGSFAAGILRHMPALVALTAPSLVSYARLVPHRWSAAFNNLADRDREAGIRICPTSARDEAGKARQFNLEYRAADAAANPHLALAALVAAGLQGIEEGLPAPAATSEDLSLLAPDALAARGLRRLPGSLEAALAELVADAAARSWLPDGFVELYRAHKEGEIAALAGRSEAEVCRAYAEAY